MRLLWYYAATVILASLAFAVPGDIIRGQALSGQPYNGVKGLAKDWDTGRIWVAAIDSWEFTYLRYTTMDEVTMDTEDWSTQEDVHSVYDIGYGYDYNGTKCLLVNDWDPANILIMDPATGDILGTIPDWYTSFPSTYGCAVNWDDNHVIMSAQNNNDVVSFDGSSYSIFATLEGAKNVGAAVGWGHVFILRTNPFYMIEVYLLDGTRVESIPFSAQASDTSVMGLACGRENAVGNNESLFFAGVNTHKVFEIEVGDYFSNSLEQGTCAGVKAGFR
jgi:hypothetical protein